MNIYTSCKVEDINKIADFNFEIITKKENFSTKVVINCAGLNADDIAKMLGITDFTIRPRKGEEFLLDIKRTNLTNNLIFPLPSKTSKGIIVIKTADGNPMIGPTACEIEDKDDLSTTEDGLKEVLAGAAKLVPTIKSSDIIAYFAGLRPVAGDDFIIRREETLPGCITVAGIQSPGLTAAPAIAEMVIGFLKDFGWDLIKKKDFNKTRKKTTHLFSLPIADIQKLIKQNPEYGDIVCRCEMVSEKEVKDAISRGAKTLDGIKFRTRAQAGRCHGGFCTTRLMKILAKETGKSLLEVSKRGEGSEIIKGTK